MHVGSRLHPSHVHFQLDFRHLMEEKLKSWVVVHPTAFPELIADALFFVNIMPVSILVLSTHI
jgi:hypothetical protein